MGRKPLDTVAKERIVALRLTASEYDELAVVAAAANVPISTWARDLLLTTARAATPAVTPAKKSVRKTAKRKPE